MVAGMEWRHIPAKIIKYQKHTWNSELINIKEKLEIKYIKWLVESLKAICMHDPTELVSSASIAGN